MSGMQLHCSPTAVNLQLSYLGCHTLMTNSNLQTVSCLIVVNMSEYHCCKVVLQQYCDSATLIRLTGNALVRHSLEFALNRVLLKIFGAPKTHTEISVYILVYILRGTNRCSSE